MYNNQKLSGYFIFFLCLFLSSGIINASHQTDINYFVYISLRNDNAIVIYKMNPMTGGLDKVHTQSVSGAPAPLALDPAKRYLYVGQRSTETVSVYQINSQTGLLTYMNKINVVDNPVYLATDRSGRYLLTAYYNASKAAIYPIDSDGKLQSPAIQIINTSKNPHSILTDASNKYLFIPNTGASKILQFKFDVNTGMIDTNDPAEIATIPGAGPRHFDFHGEKNIVYFVNEKNSSVTAYHLNDTTGTLSSFQTISTLPDSYHSTNTCADIHLTPDNRFLYASNRGHESIAAYTVDPGTGELTSIGQYATEKTPREFDIDPTGNFLYAAGQGTDKLASYRINQTTGALEALTVFYVGDNPSWVLTAGFLDSTTTNIDQQLNYYPDFRLKQNFPNPFNASTFINYSLDRPEIVTIRIFDMTGKFVTTLISDKKTKGHHTIKWNGTNSGGWSVGSGIYFCRFEAGSNVQTNKMVLLQ